VPFATVPFTYLPATLERRTLSHPLGVQEQARQIPDQKLPPDKQSFVHSVCKSNNSRSMETDRVLGPAPFCWDIAFQFHPIISSDLPECETSLYFPSYFSMVRASGSNSNSNHTGFV
jgi:hypothetical protein